MRHLDLQMYCVDSLTVQAFRSLLRQSTHLLVICLLVLLVSCASRPDEAEAIRTITPQEAVDPNSSPTALLNSAYTSKDNRHTVLALSAGGADGAYGAGVLAGWTASGERPKFDVVTGVSTGALLAVFAFLGPEYDELVRELYTTQTNQTIFRKRGIGAIFGDSLYDNAPFKAQIEKYITPAILQRVAEEHVKGRRLYVATTNIDAGELVIWDMGNIALGGRTNPLQHFQKVLRASASVPGYFQPVYIKPKRGIQLRQAHVDGGVKEPVLYANFMGASTEKERQLFMIINGTTRRFNASTPVKASLASISRKTISELIRELQRETIHRHYVNSQKSGMDFFITSIPDNIPIASKTLDFDPVRMERLYRAGLAEGLKGIEAWARQPNARYAAKSLASVNAPQE